MQVTRWFPDTCGCVFEYEWDDTVEERTHKLKNVVKRCDAHKSLKKGEDFDAVTEENTRKNRAFGILKELKPDFDPDDFLFSFDKERKLKIDLSGKLDVSDRAELGRLIDEKIGNVEVV